MILVTGGSGYIGSHTLLELQRANLDVVVFDDLVEGHREAVGDVPLVVGSLADRALLAETLRQHSVDAVMHFAARCYVGESVTEPAKYIRDNSVGMFHLLEAMREVGVRQFVFSSTCAVYGEPDSIPMTEQLPRRPISPYGITKRFCEEMLEMYCRAYDFAVVALRYFNAAGADPDGRLGEWHNPETHLIPRILRALLDEDESQPFQVFGTDYPTADGTCIRDYVHVADLAVAHRLALGKLIPGQFQRFNLGTGKGYSVLQVIEAVEKVTGRKVPYTVAPRREGDPPELTAAVDHARDGLGFEARFKDVEDVVRHSWNWLSSHPNGFES